MMTVFPSTVTTVVMPPALVVVPFIAVTVAIDRGWRVDHWRRLVHDRRWSDIDGARNTEKHSDVRMSESRAGCARSGKAHQKKGSAFHGVLLSCSILAGARHWRTMRILEVARESRCA
jgi:hypothetical protein